MKNVLITVINYCNEKEVLEYAKMISHQTIADQISLVIVNNKKSNQSIINLEFELREIKLSTEIYNPEENLGYLNGVLYGYNKYIEKNMVEPKWMVVSNTDIIINDCKFFEKINKREYEKDIWCVAPSVFSPNNNSYDNPHYESRCTLRKINRVIWIHEKAWRAFIYWKLAILKAKFSKKEKKSSQYVYSAHGCFFVLRNEFVEKIKEKKYGGFMYSEEAYIAENILAMNKKCFYDSELELIHNENSVTGLLGGGEKSKLIANSLKYIKKEFY